MVSEREYLIRALKHLVAGNASKDEIQIIEDAGAEGKVSVVSGAKSVGVAGDVSGSLIITGDHVSINLNVATPELFRSEWPVIEHIITSQNPKHLCLRQEPQTIYNNARSEKSKFLSKYVKIIINTEEQEKQRFDNSFYWRHIAGVDTETCLVVCMNPNAYMSAQAFLNDLYLHYLVGSYKPFTYGAKWVLTGLGTGLSRVAVPWIWLVKRREFGQAIENAGLGHDHRPQSRGRPYAAQAKNMPFSEVDPKTRDLPPHSLGLSPNTYWYIISPSSISAVGFATSIKTQFDMITHCNSRLMKQLLAEFAYGHGEHVLDNRIALRRVSPAEINTDTYCYNAVFSDPWWEDDNDGIAIVSANEWVPNTIGND